MRSGCSATSSPPSAGSSSRSRSASTSCGSCCGRTPGGRSCAPRIPGRRSATGACSAPTSRGSGSTRSCRRGPGDVVKLYLIRHRIEGSSYATLTPTLVIGDAVRRLRRGGFIVWALGDRRAADPPGVLAAPGRRLGLLRRARALDGDRPGRARRRARDRPDRLRRERRRAARAHHARVRDPPRPAPAPSGRDPPAGALVGAPGRRRSTTSSRRSGCTLRSTTRCSLSSSTRWRRCSRRRRAARGRSRA